MLPLEDLGAKFCRDRTFCFDHIVVHEIIFDDSQDVTLFCTVPYFGETYSANFGLSFEQLNVILLNTSSAGQSVATALADKLKGEIEIPSVVEIEASYGEPLEVTNCIFYTTLYDIGDDGGDEDDEDDEDYDSESGDDDEEFDAYAFLIDDIRLKEQMFN